MDFITYSQLGSDINNLLQSSSVFKGLVWRRCRQKESLRPKELGDYIGTVQGFIDTYSDYAEDIQDELKKLRKVKDKPSKCIPYECIKDFVFGKTDYASALLFLDGVSKILEQYHTIDEDKFEDFFEFTVEKAFENRSRTTAGLVEDVEDLLDSKEECDATEMGHFTAVKGMKLFSLREGKELSLSIRKVINTLPGIVSEALETRTLVVSVSVVNYCIEYLTYSLVAYATRAYAIGAYAQDFIEAQGTYTKEATELINTVKVTLMHDVDESLFRDIEKYDAFKSVLDDWVREMGIQRDDVPKAHETILDHKLLGNSLVQYLRGQKTYHSPNGLTLWCKDPSETESVRDNLKEMIRNSSHQISGITTPKQELLVTIREIEPEHQTVSGYGDLMTNLLVFGSDFLGHLRTAYNSFKEGRKSEEYDPSYNNNLLFISAEIVKMLKELYTDVGVAMLTKARDIEIEINDLRGRGIVQNYQDLEIDVKGLNRRTVADNVGTGVPSTTRSPVNIPAMYALPTMESLEMYNEAVNEMLEGDPYYESGMISNIINAIQAALSGLRQRFVRWFTDKQFKAAVNWVQKNKEVLEQMTFTPPMDVLPYKKDTTIEHVDKLINGLKNGFNKDDIKDKQSLDRFINSLYNNGDPKMLKLFANENNQLKAEQITARYGAWILFGHELDDPSDVQQKRLTTADEIKTELNNIWLDNVINANVTFQGLLGKDKEITGAMNSFKGKVVQFSAELDRSKNPQQNSNTSNTQSTQTSTQNSQTNNTQTQTSTTQSNANAQGTPPPAAGTPHTEAAGDTTTSQSNATGNNRNKNSEQTDLLDTAALRVQKAINDIWVSLFNAITSSIKTQYRYIQQAYNNGQKPS